MQVREAMAEHRVRRSPAMQGGRLAGILSEGDLEQALRAAAEATLGMTTGA